MSINQNSWPKYIYIYTHTYLYIHYIYIYKFFLRMDSIMCSLGSFAIWPVPGKQTKNDFLNKNEDYLWLVGGWATPLKNMKVNWDDEIPNIWENKKCSKPPTSADILWICMLHGYVTCQSSRLVDQNIQNWIHRITWLRGPRQFEMFGDVGLPKYKPSLMRLGPGGRIHPEGW